MTSKKRVSRLAAHAASEDFLSFVLPAVVLLLSVLIIQGCSTTRKESSGFVITEEHVRGSQTASPDEGEIERQVEFGGPEIKLEAPIQDAELSPPVIVKIRFVPQAGTQIDPTSLRVQYKWKDMFWKDVTKDVRKGLSVTTTGIDGTISDEAVLEPAKHSFRVQIKDTQSRAGTAEFSFRIADTGS